MEDPRVGLYILVIVASLFIGGVGRSGRKAMAKLDAMDRDTKIATALVYFLLWPVTLVLAGWVDQTLWNMLAPAFGLPMIDLLTGIILGTLINSLLWTTGGVRTVAVEKL